ncbi:MAG: hypothetical protein H0V70_03140 [Ktedonobacteraceae bacterium]|nr:hypothetical protein [Ktedonobacteraceae bacterium]
MIIQLEGVKTALLHSEPIDPHLARKIVEDIHEIRHARTSVLQPVEIEDVVGAYVVYFNHLSTIGQVLRFRPASREKRAFGFIGEVIIRPTDDQKAMKKLFQEIYLTRSDSLFLFDLYLWPDDMPPLTFQEPGRTKDLLTIEWTRLLQEEDDDDQEGEEGDRHIGMPISSMVQKVGDGDRRIGMPLYSMTQERGGYLKGIQVRADGSEWWIAIGDDGKEMIDKSSLFWLEIRGYNHIFTSRVLSKNDIYQKLREALQLNEEKAVLADHDEIIQLQWRLDRIQKDLNGDLEDDEQKKHIATIYQTMLWSSASLNEAQREEVARQTATEIDQLRRIPS